MDYLKKIVEEIELHNPQEIASCFRNGINPNDTFRGEPLIYELISEYTRSKRFAECVKTFVAHGLNFPDTALLAVLTDDAAALEKEISENPSVGVKRYTLRCAYTPMHEVSLLHICAEFNHVATASVLVRAGVDVDVKAGIDEYGFGGQTPVFHTVNQNGNGSYDMLQFLLSRNTDLHHTVPGLIWGKGYTWETFIPAVNPISYAMMGLLPQMHRNEKTISSTVSLLMKKAFGIDYEPANIPNRYLS